MISDDLQPLATAIQKSYAITISDLTPMSGGLDRSALAFKITTAQGIQLFAKQRPDHNPGVALSSALSAAGIAEVAAPIPTTAGETTLPFGGTIILLHPFKPGQNGFEKALEPEHWQNLGEAVRKIHETQPPKDILEQLQKEPFHVEGVPQFKTQRSSPEVDRVPELRQVLDSNRDAIDEIIRRTQELANECRLRQWNLVPCHADIHVGNILAADNGEIAIVDWDTARLAPRECDLMFFCGGGITGHGTIEEQSFFEGYGDVQCDPTLFAYYRCARALEDIVSFTREACEPNPQDVTQSSESVRYLRGLFAQNMIVERALGI